MLLVRKVANRKNELLDKVKNETMQRSWCVSKPGTNLSSDLKNCSLVIITFLCICGFLGAILNTSALSYLRLLIRKLKRWESNLRSHK